MIQFTSHSSHLSPTLLSSSAMVISIKPTFLSSSTQLMVSVKPLTDSPATERYSQTTSLGVDHPPEASQADAPHDQAVCALIDKVLRCSRRLARRAGLISKLLKCSLMRSSARTCDMNSGPDFSQATFSSSLARNKHPEFPRGRAPSSVCRCVSPAVLSTPRSSCLLPSVSCGVRFTALAHSPPSDFTCNG